MNKADTSKYRERYRKQWKLLREKLKGLKELPQAAWIVQDLLSLNEAVTKERWLLALTRLSVIDNNISTPKRPMRKKVPKLRLVR